MTKDMILKISKAKDINDFYKKYPSEEAFMKVHGKEFKKAQQGLNIMSGALQDVSGQARNIGGDLTRQDNLQMMQGKGFSPISVSALQNQQLASSTSPTSKGGPDLSMLAGPASGIVKGVMAFKEEQDEKDRAEQSLAVSNVQLDASRTKDIDINRQMADNMTKKRKAMMPVNTGEEFFPIYGAGTNPLAKDGALLNRVGGNPTEIQNTYYPNDIYSDGGFEPLNDSQIKNYYYGGGIPKAQAGFMSYLKGAGSADLSQAAGMAFGNNAGSQMGKGLGDAAKMIPGIGPIAGALAAPVLSAIGGGIDQLWGPAGKIKKANKVTDQNVGMMGMQGMGKGIQQQNSSFMEDGGWVSHDWLPQVITNFGEHSMRSLMRPDPTMDTLRAGGHLQRYTPPSEEAMQTYAMGGDLKTHWGGHAETMSQNPYLPEGGETVMFRGNSHDESDGRGNTGIGVTYGDNPVEVERGEPAMKLQDGGSPDSSLVVFGNLKIPNEYVSILGDDKAKGMKFKSYVTDLSKTEAKQNKTIDKASSYLEDFDPRSSFEKLTMASQQANILGANMTLKDIAGKKQKAADLQQAINDTAKENGYEADALARGQIKYAKKGITIAQNGDRASWDIPGRIGDWTDENIFNPIGNKLGEFYQNNTSENTRNAISSIGQFLSDLNNAPVDRTARPGSVYAERPMYTGVAPAPALAVVKGGKAATAVATEVTEAMEAAKKLTAEAKLAAEAIRVGKKSKKAIAAAEKLAAEARAAEVKAKGLTPGVNLEGKSSTVKNRSSMSPITKGILKGAGVASVIGIGSHYNKKNEQSKPLSKDPSKYTIPGAVLPTYNDSIKPSSVPSTNKGNPLYNRMQDTFNQERKGFEYGGEIAQGGDSVAWKPIWATTPIYLPWDQSTNSRIPGLTDAEKMTDAEIAAAQKKQSIKPSGKKATTIKKADPLPVIDPLAGVINPLGEDINLPQYDFDVSGMNPEYLPYKQTRKEFPWQQLMGEVLPYLRPSDDEELDPRQLMGEMYALSNNQQEPVYAQGFNPQLTTPYDISMQDVLNKNQADFRAAQRTMGYNPAAQANLAAQQYQANQGVLGDQFRANQEMQNKTYAQNRQLMDQAQMTNLGIFSQQADKQSQAKSNTKAQIQAALQSISAKMLENEAKNKELKTYENLYNYRFGNDQRAQNWNPMAQFNMAGNARNNTAVPQGFEATYKQLPDGSYEVDKYTKKKEKSKNGSIVKLFK